jgi:hypothetical protein
MLCPNPDRRRKGRERTRKFIPGIRVSQEDEFHTRPFLNNLSKKRKETQAGTSFPEHHKNGSFSKAAVKPDTPLYPDENV